MKLLAVLVAAIFSIFSVATAPAVDEYSLHHIMAHGEKCGGTPDDLQGLAVFNMKESPTGKCMLACMVSDYGIRDQSGKYDKLKTKTFLEGHYVQHKHHVDAVVDGCEEELKNQPPSTDCEHGFKIASCLKEKMKQNGFFNKFSESGKEIVQKISTGDYKVPTEVKDKLSSHFDGLGDKLKDIGKHNPFGNIPRI